VNYCIYKLPEILNIGFVDSADPQEGDSTNRSQREGKSGESKYRFKVELEIDLSQFSKQRTNIYALSAVMVLLDHPTGFQTYFTYMRGDKDQWIRTSRFESVIVSSEEVLKIKNPKLMVYYQKPEKSEFSSNVISLMKVRHELLQPLPSIRESDCKEQKLKYKHEDMMAVPFFLVEKQSYLRSPEWIGWEQMLCQHGKIMITYYDVYPAKKYKNLLYKGEYASIQNSRTLRPERTQVRENHAGFNKILLGTTLLPKMIVEALLQNVRKFSIRAQIREMHVQKYRKYGMILVVQSV
jgi:hypothetical protein